MNVRRMRNRNICRWLDGNIAPRWAAEALLMTELNSPKIMGYLGL